MAGTVSGKDKKNPKSSISVSGKRGVVIGSSHSANSEDLSLKDVSGKGVKKTGDHKVELDAKIQVPFGQSAELEAAKAAGIAAIGANIINQNAEAEEESNTEPTKPDLNFPETKEMPESQPAEPVVPEAQVEPTTEQETIPEDEEKEEGEKPVPEKPTTPPTVAAPTAAPEEQSEQPTKEPPKTSEEMKEPPKAEPPKKKTTSKRTPPKTEENKTPPTTTGQPAVPPQTAPQTSPEGDKQKGKLPPNTDERQRKNKQTEPKTPPVVSDENLKDIGPRGKQKKGKPGEGITGATPPIVNPGQVSSGFNSQKLAQPNEAATQSNQGMNKHIQNQPLSEQWTQEDEAKHQEEEKQRKEKETKEDEAYEKMNFLQKRNLKKQQKKLLKEISKKAGKLLNMWEKPVLTYYFPEMVWKTVKYQEEIDLQTKLLSRKKTIHRKDGPIIKMDWESELFSYLVIEPELKVGAFKEAWLRFDKYWLSWAMELWWWTIIMAIFDIVFVFPIVFLIMGSVINGPGLVLLKKIKKRNSEMRELILKLKRISKPKGGDENYSVINKLSYEK